MSETPDKVRCLGFGRKCGFNHKLFYHPSNLKYGRCKTCAPKYEKYIRGLIEALEEKQSKLRNHLEILKTDFERNIAKTNNKIQQNAHEIADLLSGL